MRAAFYTLGCKVNQYESQVLAQLFASSGFSIVNCEEPADVYIVNSCTVTAAGDKKTRQALHRFKRQNPGAIVCVTGCFPQAFPDKAALIPEADIITGALDRGELLNSVISFMENGQRIVNIQKHQKSEAFEPMRAQSFFERTRAFIKIEDGCDKYCSYCIIPAARGPIRSKPLAELKAELSGLAKTGYKEAVLVGINLSSYGKDIGLRLTDAVKAACETNGIGRVRLGSLEPELMTDEDVEELAKQPKFCPQFHLSLQSGCDETLKRMNRHYDSTQYFELVEKLRNIFENCAVTTDIMVGFPGETAEEFEKSLAFAQKAGFAKAHVFAYSKREGTKAAAMPNQIPKSVKEERSHKMTEITELSRKLFMEGQIGTKAEVLFETHLGKKQYEGYTKNYVPVLLESESDIRGQVLRVVITGCTESHCTGNIQPD